LGRTIPILAYHKVDTEAPTRFWIRTDSFELQMALLRERGHETVSLEDLWLFANGAAGLPRKSVCITFDDGYENFFSRAFPILRKYGFKATVFLPTAFIGTDCRHSNEWDRSPEESFFRADHMLWTEVLQLQKYGMEFGAHTRTHADLVRLLMTDPEQAEAEIAVSKNDLEDRLTVKAKFFSYPYRSSNSCLEEMVRRAGFLGAVIMNNKAFDLSDGNWFQMDRIPVFSGVPGRSDKELRADFLALLGEKI